MSGINLLIPSKALLFVQIIVDVRQTSAIATAASSSPSSTDTLIICGAFFLVVVVVVVLYPITRVYGVDSLLSVWIPILFPLNPALSSRLPPQSHITYTHT